jgi:rhodanese-related sulfurtransferase
MLDLNPTAAFAIRDAARIIDVREPDEFTGELGHIPGAELVPLATVERTAAAWDRTAPLIVVCRSGGRSGRAAQALIRAGFHRVMNLAGGMLAYRAAGLPVVYG